MTDDQPRNLAQAAPTEENPERGEIRHRLYGIQLCAVEHWLEDGLHVIRAADFDLMAVDEDHAQAVHKFVEEAYSLEAALRDLIERKEATLPEADLYIRLAGPILDAARRELDAVKGRESRIIDFPRLRRRRGDHSGGWRQVSGHAKSNQLSTA